MMWWRYLFGKWFWRCFIWGRGGIWTAFASRKHGGDFFVEYGNEYEFVVGKENDNKVANAVNNDGKKGYHGNSFIELLEDFKKEGYHNGPLSDEMKQLVLNYFHCSRNLMLASNYIWRSVKG